MESYPDNSEVLSLTGSVYINRIIDIELAEKMLVRSVAMNPNDPMTLIVLANYLSTIQCRRSLTLR